MLPRLGARSSWLKCGSPTCLCTVIRALQPLIRINGGTAFDWSLCLKWLRAYQLLGVFSVSAMAWCETQTAQVVDKPVLEGITDTR